MLNDLGVAVLVRFPLVPGVNAIPEHFEGIGKLVAQLIMPRDLRLWRTIVWARASLIAWGWIVSNPCRSSRKCRVQRLD